MSLLVGLAGARPRTARAAPAGHEQGRANALEKVSRAPLLASAGRHRFLAAARRDQRSREREAHARDRALGEEHGSADGRMVERARAEAGPLRRHVHADGEGVFSRTRRSRMGARARCRWGAHSGRRAARPRARRRARHRQLGHGRARQPVRLLENRGSCGRAPRSSSGRRFSGRGLGGALGPAGTPRQGPPRRRRASRPSAEVGAEVASPRRPGQDVIRAAAKATSEYCRARPRHRAAALLDRDLGRAREAQLLRHHA